MARRSVKWIFIGVVLLIWVVLAAAAAEVFARIRQRHMEAQGLAYGEPRIEAANAADQEARRAISPNGDKIEPPSWAIGDLFETWPEEERQASAERRRELVLLMDREGVVESQYVPGNVPELVEAGARLGRGTNFPVVLGEAEAADSKQAIKVVLDSGNPSQRFYGIALGDRTFQAHFQFLPRKNSGNEVTGLSLFIQQSMWEIPWFRHARNYYINAGAEYWTNQFGFRDDPIEVPKPAGVYRIACIGGSTTFEGVTNPLTYPEFLERKLRERLGTDKIEVVNCGVDALGLGGEVQKMPEYLAIEPDLIIHYNFVNDLPGLLQQWSGNAPETRSWVSGFRNLLRGSSFVWRYANRLLLPGGAVIEQDLQKSIFESLANMLRQARERGVAMAACSFAYPDARTLGALEVEYFNYRIANQSWGWERSINLASYGMLVRLHNRLMKDFCAANGVTYVPVAEQLSGGTDLFLDICHMNARGIERKADIVCDAVAGVVAQALKGESGG